jgi:hypothetical protein
VLVEAPTQLVNATIAGLPEGVVLAEGEIRVRFADPQQASSVCSPSPWPSATITKRFARRPRGKKRLADRQLCKCLISQAWLAANLPAGR